MVDKIADSPSQDMSLSRLERRCFRSLLLINRISAHKGLELAEWTRFAEGKTSIRVAPRSGRSCLNCGERSSASSNVAVPVPAFLAGRLPEKSLSELFVNVLEGIRYISCHQERARRSTTPSICLPISTTLTPSRDLPRSKC